MNNMNNLKKVILATALSLSVIGWIRAKGIIFQTDFFSVLTKNGCQRVRSLKGKKGEFLGYIYVKENPKYANHVLTALLVIKVHGSKLDTLYQINAYGDFVNSSGKIELKNPDDHKYYGFKLYQEKKDRLGFFDIGEVDKKGTLFSDDNVYFIDWNYKSKKFEYYPAP